MDRPANYPYTAEDDKFHTPSNDEWETETNWWSFNVPERKIGGWIHCAARPNRKRYDSRIFVWDDSGWRTEDLPYYKIVEGPLPEAADLRDITFPNGGHTLRMLKPLMDYHITYRDPEQDFEIEIEHRGIHLPFPFRTGEPPFRESGHFDQAGHVIGHLKLKGERIAIDCFSVRDRSWGPRGGPHEASRPPRADTSSRFEREERGPRWRQVERSRGRGRIQYIFGTADAKTGFCAFVRPQDGDGSGWSPINSGFLMREGLVSPLVKQQSRMMAFRDPVFGFSRQILVAGADEAGRAFEAEGYAVSNMSFRGAPSQNALLRWEFDNKIAWGEDQDIWRPDHAEELLKTLRDNRYGASAPIR